MPVQSILLQPTANSVNAAYRPIIMRVQAISTTFQPAPPVVFCDIYVNNVFYKSIIKSKYDILNTTNTEWQFDIQDIQEALTYELPPYGDFRFITTQAPVAVVFCRFRASYFDDDGLTIPEDTAPVQATSSTPATDGTGLQSNIFVVVNATLKHEDAQDLALHLSFFRYGTFNPLAFPLTHRPKRYYIGKNSSDHYPFLYLGTRSIPCIRVTLNKKDGTQEVLTHCFPLPPCTITVSNLRIKKAWDFNDGRTYYFGDFVVSNTVDHYIFELSTDGGTTWINLTTSGYNLVVDTVNHVIRYNAKTDGTPADHQLRITAFCDADTASIPAVASYTVPACPSVIGLNVAYNSASQQLTYAFGDPNNLPQTIKLYKDGSQIDERVNAPNTGSWTIVQEGDYYVTSDTICSAAEGLVTVDTSNTVTVVINNPLCNAPYNLSIAFSSDGNSITATWQVADNTYSDLIKWYNADTNEVLLQGVVAAAIHTANIGVTMFPNVQKFYATVQHQCPAPSTVTQSNWLQRDNTYTLSLDYSAGDTIQVLCKRYGQLAPAPFSATINIVFEYTTGGGGSHPPQEASNVLQKGNTSQYLYGSSGITIVTATIQSVTPNTNSQFTYIW